MHDFHWTVWKQHDNGGSGDGDINNERLSATTVLFVRHEQGSPWFLSLAYNAARLMYYVMYLIVLVSFICIVIMVVYWREHR